MKCVILAAGRGSRLNGRSDSKPLCPVAGRALVEWVLLSAAEAGLKDFVIVTGYARERVERDVGAFCRGSGLRVAFVPNEEWERENGLSVCKARGHVRGRFALMMSDHVFDPPTAARLVADPLDAGDLVLAVDRRIRDNPLVDLDDVTRVRTDGGAILQIGKGLAEYDAFDTGMFLCTPGLFAALDESQRRGDFSLSGGVRVLAGRRRAWTMDVGDASWVDVDDEPALAKAERLLARR